VCVYIYIFIYHNIKGAKTVLFRVGKDDDDDKNDDDNNNINNNNNLGS
jgi:hypothetical protein